ncbi:MAG: hypothetical protein QXT88_01825 [Desulfurococcaceae archaeon]|uniref:Uncharacterized protein n=1 Tax=Staphylothermus marinus TaxID=2280 RepID=A0A7C4JL84_STAMA
MPKNPSVIFREELAKHGYELLDIYRYRDRDIVRFLDKNSGRVLLYESKKHIDELNTIDEVRSIVSEIMNYIRTKKS